MARYLSEEWIEEVNVAAGASRPLRHATASAQLTLQQVVTGGPEGDVAYWVRVDRGAVVVGGGHADQADATVQQSYQTAVALSRGELSPEAAFASGAIRVSGDMAVLVRHHGALQGLDDAFAAVRARTSYP